MTLPLEELNLTESKLRDEQPLPKGWVWTNLGEITEPSKEKVNPQEIERMPYVGLAHIEKDTGKLLGFGYSEEVRSTKAVFHRGDLLYGKLRPYLNKVHVADFDGVCSTDILVFPKSTGDLSLWPNPYSRPSGIRSPNSFSSKQRSWAKIPFLSLKSFIKPV